MRRYWDEKFETMGLGEMEDFQSAKLKETAAWVYEKIPYYKEKFDELGVKPEDIKSIEDISKLPFTVKTDLRDNYPFGLCAFPLGELARIHASSGTTGKPITGPYTPDDMEQWSDCMARTLYAQGIRENDIVQNAYGMGLFTGGLGFLQGAIKIGCCIVPTGSGMTERQIILMKDFGSTVLFCTPSYALTIAEKADEMGIDIKELPLKVGSFGAEPWTVEMRKEIEQRMNIAAHEAYGLTEMMGPGVGFSCEGYKIHLNEDHTYPEIVDPETLKPLPLGEKGELVFTAIQRRAMPLLRYRTRDITSLRRVECECGRTLVVMDKILGRSDDMLIISGVNVFPSQVEALLMEVEGLQPHYQLRVKKKGYLDQLSVEVEASADAYNAGKATLDGLAEGLSAKIFSTIGIRVPVQIVALGEIPRSEGKAKRVIDERDQ